MAAYIIVQNVPGYLPESDPLAVETLQEAINAVESEVSSSLEHYEEAGEPVDTSWSSDRLSCHIVPRADHALGVVIEATYHEEVNAEEFNEEAGDY